MIANLVGAGLRGAVLAGCALALMACDSSGTGAGPGAVSEGEARALDEAAEMLDERRLPDGVLPPTGAEAVAGEAAAEEAASAANEGETE